MSNENGNAVDNEFYLNPIRFSVGNSQGNQGYVVGHYPGVEEIRFIRFKGDPLQNTYTVIDLFSEDVVNKIFSDAFEFSTFDLIFPGKFKLFRDLDSLQLHDLIEFNTNENIVFKLIHNIFPKGTAINSLHPCEQEGARGAKACAEEITIMGKNEQPVNLIFYILDLDEAKAALKLINDQFTNKYATEKYGEDDFEKSWFLIPLSLPNGLVYYLFPDDDKARDKINYWYSYPLIDFIAINKTFGYVDAWSAHVTFDVRIVPKKK